MCTPVPLDALIELTLTVTSILLEALIGVIDTDKPVSAKLVVEFDTAVVSLPSTT
jgi:hypothetical protein